MPPTRTADLDSSAVVDNMIEAFVTSNRDDLLPRVSEGLRAHLFQGNHAVVAV